MHFKLTVYSDSDIESKIASIPFNITSMGIHLYGFYLNLDLDENVIKLTQLFSSIPMSVTDLDLNCNSLGSTDTLKDARHTLDNNVRR